MKLLEANNLSHSFDYELFSNISLSLKSHDSIAIIGASGSGKSTLLNILSTLLAPNHGELKLFNKQVASLTADELSDIKRHKLGIVFQSHYLFKGFSALENLEVAAMLSNQTIDTKLLEKLNISHQMMKKVTELSGGQQQRVSIARVLTKKPSLLFVDEPTGNLDKETAREVMDIFFEYIKENNAALIMVTHDEELAHRCSRVYKLTNKKLVDIVVA